MVRLCSALFMGAIMISKKFLAREKYPPLIDIIDEIKSHIGYDLLSESDKQALQQAYDLICNILDNEEVHHSKALLLLFYPNLLRSRDYASLKAFENGFNLFIQSRPPNEQQQLLPCVNAVIKIIFVLQARIIERSASNDKSPAF